MYSMEGANFNQTNSTIGLHCINLPLMFQYNASGGLVLEAGHQLGFLLSAKENGVDATNDYKNLNVALGVGTAYRFKKGFDLGVRYNAGVTNLFKDAGLEAQVKGSVVQLSLTLSLSTLKRR